MKSSSLFRRATKVSQERMTFWPPTSSTVSSTTALSKASPRDSSICSALLFKAGISTSKGTTAKS